MNTYRFPNKSVWVRFPQNVASRASKPPPSRTSRAVAASRRRTGGFVLENEPTVFQQHFIAQPIGTLLVNSCFPRQNRWVRLVEWHISFELRTGASRVEGSAKTDTAPHRSESRRRLGEDGRARRIVGQDACRLGIPPCGSLKSRPPARLCRPVSRRAASIHNSRADYTRSSTPCLAKLSLYDRKAESHPRRAERDGRFD